ncbi:UPF0041 BRAIN PROTEIN 44-RELATED [Salix purpurea]|uniref:UPF0041 BRAIN PROTEIN 44-RELATED n=1 Tax=Salix purpurea TaxID=77065 RepID=A0A9Q0PQW2_SALPP|nr:UPF0041 BRAIN PROTEIN 44-RELATED [Salix purpurea]
MISRTSRQKKAAGRATFVSVRCEKSTREDSGVDVWIGRLAMVGFAGVIGVETATGKGLLENFGLTAPLPTVALAVTGLMGVLTALIIFHTYKWYLPPNRLLPLHYEAGMFYLPMGFNVETVVYKNISFTVWDVGGQQKGRISEARNELHRILSDVDRAEVVICTFCRYIQNSSATSGSGLDEGLDWLSNNISNEAT